VLEFSKDLIRAASCFDSWISFSASTIKRTVFQFSSTILHRNKADSSTCCDLGTTCVLLSSKSVALRCELSDCTRDRRPIWAQRRDVLRDSQSLALGQAIASPNRALMELVGHSEKKAVSFHQWGFLPL
jgi:hypothetical protein